MTTINWITSPGFLFTATDGTAVQTAITATNADSYVIISGSLPDGLSFSSTGTISGIVKTVIDPTVSTFVIRAENTGGKKDRTFQIFVPAEDPPVWQGPSGFVQVGTEVQGFILNKEYVDIQFVAGPPLVHDKEYPITYSVQRNSRRLPRGLHFSPTGHLYGIVRIDELAPGEYFPFTFTAEASDGFAVSTQTVIVNVINSDTFRVDSDVLVLSTGTATISLIDLALPGSASLSFIIPPEFVNGSDLGYFNSDDKQYIPVTVYDATPSMGPVIYELVSGTIPDNLSLDAGTGYLYGYIPPQPEYLKNYSFVVNATKYDWITNNSLTATNTFTMGVWSNQKEIIKWNTDSDLGTLEQGIESELSVEATTTSVYDLQYRLMPGNHLPTGLTLSSVGNIIGVATTSGVYTATILASTGTYTDLMLSGDVFPYAFSTRTFTLNVQPVSTQYTSMYVKPFLSLKQRDLYNDFITSSSIFIPELLYRAEDPNFGLQTEIKMYLEFGIEKLNIDDYAPSLYTNFYKRRLLFGDVKIAKANDSKGNHVYDVVYVDIVDEIAGSKKAITINNKVYYPGSIDNMRNSLESTTLPDHSTIHTNEHNLPRFMRTAQIAGERPSEYIKTVVLCYTLPGQGTKITSRIKASKFDFKLLDFEIDRIVVQNSLDHETAQYLIFPHSTITDQS